MSKQKNPAIKLRKQGKSYSQIKNFLNLSKSTLSSWLRDYPLSKERIRELRSADEQRIERYRETMRQKKEKRLKETYRLQKKKVLPFSKRDFFIAGLFLYWAEGTKSRKCGLSMTNSDPSLLKFFIDWLNVCFYVSRDKLKIHLHLYADMDNEQEIRFWSKRLGVSRNQFTKSYIKTTLSTRINHKGSFGHGTCNVTINRVLLAENVLMGLKVISDKYKKGM